jgi:amidophosphoribosyltransferase
MCGIVGLFLKDRELQPFLGALISEMLVTMTDRGPDSAGIAIYGNEKSSDSKLTVQSENPRSDFPSLASDLGEAIDSVVEIEEKDTHAVIRVPSNRIDTAKEALNMIRDDLRLMSLGKSIEIFKEVGLPKDFISRFNIASMSGSHGVGHTRMATESAVTTLGAHPFSTGSDQCLVHNGSLSNHNSLRRKLVRQGIQIETENDSEVAAAYLTQKIQNGQTLDEALTCSLEDLDGFYTFLVGTRKGFGVLRDPIACKPAVMAETNQYVAFGSEYRALVSLPDIDNANVWEPEPATVYFWEH